MYNVVAVVFAVAEEGVMWVDDYMVFSLGEGNGEGSLCIRTR